MRSTRQSKLLHLPAVRTEVAKRSFYYHGCTVYNNFRSYEVIIIIIILFSCTYKFDIYVLDFYN